jgi:CitB family two-component system response regulator MalR
MKKLLILEDDEILNRAYVQKFSNIFELKIATDVFEAEKSMESYRPDVILLDLYIPGKTSGIDFLKSIKENYIYRKIPVIVTTNLPDSSDLVINLGAESCFMKSNISMEKIVEEINRVVSMVK